MAEEIEGIGAQLATLGANMTELEVAEERLNNQVFLSEAGISRLTSDVLVDESTRLAKEQIRLQSSQALLAQAFSLSENILNTLFVKLFLVTCGNHKWLLISSCVDLKIYHHTFLKPQTHWERAKGYLELCMYDFALRELRAIPEDEIWTKKVTILTLSIYQELENWAEAQKYARNLRYEFSDELIGG